MQRQGVKLFAAAGVISQASALIRFVILARVLGAQELGLAAMLILTAQFFQSVSDTGSDRFLVQDRDGDTEKMQGLVQLVMVVRGVLIGVGLFLLANLISTIYRQPDLTTSLQWLAIAPILGGFAHMDYRRVQRSGDFRPESTNMIVSEVSGVVATAVAALIVRDHTAVIYGMVVRSIALVVITHLVAKRPYRWSWTSAEAMRFSHFAAPLFLNGVLLFFGSQGDRVIVGSTLGAEALGKYSAVLLLIFYPAAMVVRFVSGVFLPQLARARENSATYETVSARFGGRCALLSIAVALGFGAIAPIATPILYGPEFIQTAFIVMLIGTLQSCRLLRMWPTTIANSIGRSTTILSSNVVRIAGLPLALAAYYVHPSLPSLLFAFIAGELVACMWAVGRLSRANAIPFLPNALRVLGFMGATASAAVIAWGASASSYLAASGGLIALAGILVAIVASERAIVTEAIRIVRGRILRR